MRIPGVKKAKTFSRWVQARIFRGALILGYHRVDRVASDVYEVCVTPEHFAQHLEVLRKHARPISLSKLVQYLRDGKVPAGSVAVTFDDGYADNLYHAKALLEEHEVPATVFVSTGYAGREFWWDELDRLIMISPSNLGDLHLHADQRKFEWVHSSAMPKPTGIEDENIRKQFMDALYRFLLPLDVEERENAMDTIRKWSALPLGESSLRRAMNTAELLKLAEGGLVELGAHTKNHPMLPHLSLERQREEIITCKQDLESLLNKEIAGFAYPNGRATAEAKRIVRDAGFFYACTSLHDVIHAASDRYELTRFWHKDVDGEQFMRNLKSWM